MALKIWMPFINNTDNQGLCRAASLHKTVDAYTSQSSGKLGKSYSGYGLYHADNDFLGNQWSIAVWFNANSYGPYNNIIFCKNIANSNDCQIYWSIISNTTYNIGVNGPSGTTSYSYTFNTSTWYHLATTYDGTRIRMYINGELVRDVGYTSTQATDCLNWAVGTRSTNTNGTTAYGGNDWKYNDFRLYDTAISTKEVEELARGLVVHYKLSDSYIEGTTNLVTTQDGLSNTCYNGATGKYSYGTNTDMYKEVTTWEGRQGTKVHMGTDNLSAYPYVYFDAFDASGTAIKTLSFDYYPTLQDTLIPYSYNGYYNWSCYVNGRYFSATNVGQIVLTGVRVNQWNHIEVTAQKYDTTSAARGIGYIRLGSASHTSNTSNFWFFSNIQVEAKDHATAYAGVGGTRATSLKVKDSSGFGYHGTASNTLTTSTTAARYTSSIYMPAATTISHTRALDTSNQEWTCCAWIKATTAGDYRNLNDFNLGNRIYHGTYPLLYLNSGTNDYYNYGNMAVPVNEWVHIAFVFKNSSVTKLIYINGVERTNKSGPNKTSTPAGLNATTVIGTNFVGYMCDYREYATALTAKQIEELYNETAAIDRSGALYVREVIE